MGAPIRNEDYPRYFINKKKLVAFKSKDSMYKVEPIGSNLGNLGVTIDAYKTRRMVIHHWENDKGKEVSKQEFKETLEQLFAAYIDKIVT